MYVGMEHLPMAATVSASNVFWLGCAVDTRCGSVVSILDSQAAAHRDLRQYMRDLLEDFSSRITKRCTPQNGGLCLLCVALAEADDLMAVAQVLR